MNVTSQAQALLNELNNGQEDLAYLMEWNLEQDERRNRYEREEDEDEL